MCQYWSCSWAKKRTNFFLYNRNFIAVHISTRLINSPLRLACEPPTGAQDVVRIAVGPQVSTVPILTEGMAPSFSMLPSVISITPYSSRSSPKCLLEPDTADVISQINSDMTLFLTSCRLRCKSRLASVFSEMRDKKSVYVTLFAEGRTFSLVCLFANSTAALLLRSI